jgi:hypothetical protein
VRRGAGKPLLYESDSDGVLAAAALSDILEVPLFKIGELLGFHCEDPEDEKKRSSFKQRVRRHRNAGQELASFLGIWPWSAFGGKLEPEWWETTRVQEELSAWRATREAATEVSSGPAMPVTALSFELSRRALLALLRPRNVPPVQDLDAELRNLDPSFD